VAAREAVHRTAGEAEDTEVSTKEYAGTDLQEIREYFTQDHEIRYTRVVKDDGAKGFTLSAPNGDYSEEEAEAEGNLIYVVVWPRAEGGYWCEEY
jgi:hypothetical protein